MRQILICMIFLLMPAGILFAQDIIDQPITADYENLTLVEILTDIEKNYPVNFFYKQGSLPEQSLSIKFHDTPFSTALTSLLDNSGFSFAIYQSAVIIAPRELLGEEYSMEYYMARKKQQRLIQSEKWSTATAIITLGDSLHPSGKNEVFIQGSIRDRLSDEPLVGVNFYFEAMEKAFISDQNGLFRMVLPPGYNLMEVSYVGYDPIKVLLRVFGEDDLHLKMDPDAYELEEILISGEANDNNVQSSIIGITRLSPKQIKELPVFLGEADVIKSILTLPGVSTIGEGASGFNVRGGTIDQNLILQDEALIFNSSHALGFFSVFNPDAIREVTLYKGHMPAQYGGRLSSVLDVRLKGHSAENLNIRGGIGMVSSRLLIEAPLRSKSTPPDQLAKTTLLAAGRITYSDWMLRMIKNPDISNSAAFFYDTNLKLNHRYSDKGSVTATYYQSYDKVQFSNEYGFSWKNMAASMIWNHTISESLASTFSFSGGQIDNLSFDPVGIDAYNLTNGLSNIRVKEEMAVNAFRKHQIITGGEYTRYFMHSDQIERGSIESTVIPRSTARDDGHEMGFFINDDYVINHLVSVSGGIRLNFFQHLGPSTLHLYEPGYPRDVENIIDTVYYKSGEAVKSFFALEPRISVKYSLDPASSIKLSYNRTNQFIHLISNTTSAIPVDFWQVSGPYYSPETADNFSIGYFRNFMNNTWETSIETYYRSIANQLEYKDLPELLLNDALETEILAGKGSAYGAELLIRKTRGRLHGWLSYAYARSFIRLNGKSPEETVNNGEWYPSKLDKPHNLNLVMNINLNKSNTFSANFTLNSGRPITSPELRYTLDDIVLPHYTERNQYRIPAYHRLDLSYTIKRNIIKRKRYKDSFTFAVYNLYARKNAYSIYFRKLRTSGINAYKLSVLGSIFPSITYNFEF